MALKSTSKFFALFISVFVFSALEAQNNWTWIHGLNANGQKGLYGTMGVSGATNTPGCRFGAINWTDLNGNLWLYGGWGKDTSNINNGVMADLWKYDVSAGQWVWVSGSNINYQGTNPVYGTMGTASSSNNPGYRSGSATWTDNSGDLWLFGGTGLNTSGSGSCFKNDLWKYNISSNQWTWMGGSNGCYSYATYGTKGVMTSSNVPGARTGMCYWKDTTGNFWLWGGDAVINSTTNGHMNDLWKYDVSAGQWTWVHGSNSFYAASAFGTMGTGSSTTTPGGARWGSNTWRDKNGVFWLFGGHGTDNLGSFGALNDLWKYDPQTNVWTWMRGTKLRNQPSLYGSMNVYATANQPGGMGHSGCWADSTGTTLYFGPGSSTDNLNSDFATNTMWKYNILTNEWAWAKGPNFLADHFGNYGTKGVTAISNIPGGRHSACAWQGNNGEFWLFGGFGGGAQTGYSGMLNDLWKFTPCYSGAVTVTNTSTSSNTVVCANNTVTLTATGTGTLTWYDINSNLIATGNSVAVIAGTTSPTYLITDNASCLPTSITVSLMPTPTLNITGASAICQGATATLTAISGAAFTSWSNGSSNYSTTVTPSVTTTYSVAVTNYPYGCTTSGVKTITVNPVPTLSISASSNTTCGGTTVTLTALSSAPVYSWTGGSTSSVITVTPNSTTTYSVRVTSSGCQTTSFTTITVTTAPTLTIMPLSSVVCQGGAVTMTALSNAGGFLWSTGSTVSVTTVSPGSNTTYSVTVTDLISGCSRSGTKSLTVVAPPTLTLSPGSTTLCQGTTLMLTALSNATIFTWDNVPQGSQNWNVTPSVTSTYSVIATGNTGCTSTTAITISVTPSPTVSISASGTALCPGSAISLTATASGGPLLWNTSSTNSVISATFPGTYSVSVTDTVTGCAGSDLETISLNQQPVVYVVAGSPTACAGQTIDLVAYGSSVSYSWSTGQTTSSISVSPQSTTSYSVLVTDVVTTCTSGALQTITVFPVPVVAISSNTNAVCPGKTASVVASSNASGYLWSTGSTSSIIAVSVSSTSAYNVTVTSANTGCSASAAITITVLPSPSVSVTGVNAACKNQTMKLTANAGAVTYSWMPGGQTSTLNVFVDQTKTYSVQVTDISTGCTNIAVHTVSMVPVPTLSFAISQQTVCPGTSATMTLFSNATTHSWSTGGTGTVEVFSPASQTTITATVSKGGCTAEMSKTLYVFPLIPMNIVADSSTLCESQLVTISASGASSYTWDTGALTQSIGVTPTITTSYSVSGHDVNGCVISASKTILVGICAGVGSEFSVYEEVEVYPNPTNGELTVKLPSSGRGQLVVFNTLGQELLSEEIYGEHTQVSIPSTNGIYFVRVRWQTAGGKLNTNLVKVVKQ